MTPQISSWDDLAWISEGCSGETDDLKFTTFGIMDGDVMYFGQLDKPKANIPLQEVASAMSPVADQDIYSKWPPLEIPLTQAPDELMDNVYIKQPSVEYYGMCRRFNAVHQVPQSIMEEAQALELVAQHPHPNLIGYHGCLVRRGYVTGLVMDRHDYDLYEFVRQKKGNIHIDNFMAGLESAIQHLHALGWAHNDVTPNNILVNKNGLPVLIDFDSCYRVGEKLKRSRGTEGWREGETKDYSTSQTSHDIFAIGKMREWLVESMAE